MNIYDGPAPPRPDSGKQPPASPASSGGSTETKNSARGFGLRLDFYEKFVLPIVAIVVAGVFGGASLYQTVHADHAADRQQEAERFAGAVALLAAPNVGVRLGGVRAVTDLAQEYPAERRRVLDILTAYLAGQITVPAGCNDPNSVSGSWLDDPGDRDLGEALSSIVNLYSAQLADDAVHPQRTPYVLNLSGLCLAYAPLNGANLSGADLSYSWLVATHLQGTTLNCANLADALFQDAELVDTHLFGADLSGAAIKNTAPHDHDLLGVDLREANLNGVRFKFAPGGGFQVEADVTGATGRDSVTIEPDDDDLSTTADDAITPPSPVPAGFFGEFGASSPPAVCAP